MTFDNLLREMRKKLEVKLVTKTMYKTQEIQMENYFESFVVKTFCRFDLKGFAVADIFKIFLVLRELLRGCCDSVVTFKNK